MPIINVSDLYSINPNANYAIAGFNVNNLEYTQAVMKAAEKMKTPVILMLGEPMLPFIGLEIMVALCRFSAEKSDLPIAISLDHGKTPEIIERFIELGLSIMVDGSHLELEENIRFTRTYAEKAHAAGLSVEGELGTIGGVEDGEMVEESAMTDPEAAEYFVKETGVDLLAVAIGNSHGLYKGIPNLDLKRLEQIHKRVDIPLVLHGGSDLPDEQVKQALGLGIKKVNIGTDLKYAFARSLKETLTYEPMPYQPPAVMEKAREAMYSVACSKIELFGSVGFASYYISK